MKTDQRGRYGGPSSFPARITVVAICILLATVAAACDRDRSDRATPRATGREIEEPFADLYVMAGRSADRARLYALDLLNLELEPLKLEERVTSLVGRCDDRAIVEVARGEGAGGRLRALVGEELSTVSEDVMADPRCTTVLTNADPEGWVVHDTAPSGNTLISRGRKVGVARNPEEVEILGRTRFPIWTAVWVRR